MKVVVRESVRSTPERPLWLWRVWNGRSIAAGFGTAGSQEAAADAAEAALRRLEAGQGMIWSITERGGL